MKKYLLCSLVFACLNIVQSQTLTPEIQSDLQLPVIFPTGQNNQHCLLFYADELQPDAYFKFQVAVLDSLDHKLQLNPVTNVNALRPGDKKLRLLCSFTNKQAYIAWFKSRIGIYQVAIDRVSLQVNATYAGVLTDEETVLGGISMDSTAIILTRGQKDNRKLYLYRPENEGMKQYAIKGLLPKHFDEDYPSPLLVKKNLDLRPDDASINGKIFHEGNKLYWTYENIPNYFANAPMSLTLVTIDLPKDSLYSEDIDFPNNGMVIPGASGSTFIFEGNLFQFYYDKDWLGLQIRTLEERKMVFRKFVSGEDTLALLNCTVNYPGFLGWGWLLHV